MEFAGVEYCLLPATTQVASARLKDKRKDAKVWLSGELIVRCERQGLTELPPQLMHKTTLHKLILTGNQLSSLPPELFQQLKDLRELRVGHNKLTELPDDVQLLQHLVVLDVQHNLLHDVPASLCKCAQLKVVNLNGNPVYDSVRQLWGQPLAIDAAPKAGSGSSLAEGHAAQRQHSSGGVLQQLKAHTRALLDHLLQSQDPEIVQQVQAVRFAELQAANLARVHKLLRVTDLDSLAECARLAAAADLGQQVLLQVQEMRAAAEAVQDAMQHACREQQHEAAGEAVPVSLQQQLAASLRHVQDLCKPGRPSGELCAAAHHLLRTLQQQQQQRGWRYTSSSGGTATCDTPAAIPAVDVSAADTPGSSAAVPRRFLTSAERRRQQLAATGAKTYQEWVGSKQQQHEHQRQLIKDLIKTEVEGRLRSVADRATHVLENCERERQWPSRRVEPHPPGSFSLNPQQLRAVRKAYYKLPPPQ